jgi:hypothetical protein
MQRNNDELQLQIDQKEYDIATEQGRPAAAKKASNKIYADHLILGNDDLSDRLIGESSAACSAQIAVIEQRAWIPIALCVAGVAFLIVSLALYPRKSPSHLESAPVS